MAEQAADEAAVPVAAEAPAARAPLPLIGVGVAIVSAIALALLIGPPVIVLAACVACGFGITYLSAVALNLEERIAYGTVIGAMALTSVSFVLSLVVRDVTLFTVITASLIATAVGVATAWLHRDTLAADWRDIAARWSPRLSTPGHP